MDRIRKSWIRLSFFLRGMLESNEMYRSIGIATYMDHIKCYVDIQRDSKGFLCTLYTQIQLIYILELIAFRRSARRKPPEKCFWVALDLSHGINIVS